MATINITQKSGATGNPTIDAQFKHIRSYGTTELKSAVFVDSYNATQPNAKALGNTGAAGYIEIGSNQKSNPVGLYGKDTQFNAANPNLGKLSIKPNFHSPDNAVETDEMVGIGSDNTNSVGKIMPTGMWVRSKNEAGTGYNAAFSLTNIPDGGATAGKVYTSVCNATTDANPGQYNMYLTDITASVESNVNVIRIQPTSATTANYTIAAPPSTANAPSIFLIGNVDVSGNHKMNGIVDISGSVNITGNTAMTGSLNITGNTLMTGNLSIVGNLIISSSAYVGLVALSGATPSVATVTIAGMTGTAVVMLTQTSNGGGPPLPDLLYTATSGQFVISTSVASTAEIAYNVIKL